MKVRSKPVPAESVVFGEIGLSGEVRAVAQASVRLKEAAKLVHADHSKTWKNEKHAAQWINTLKEYAYPHFGDRAIDQIGSADVLSALSPIWLTKPETARRVRQRIGTVWRQRCHQ